VKGDRGTKVLEGEEAEYWENETGGLSTEEEAGSKLGGVVGS